MQVVVQGGGCRVQGGARVMGARSRYWYLTVVLLKLTKTARITRVSQYWKLDSACFAVFAVFGYRRLVIIHSLELIPVTVIRHSVPATAPVTPALWLVSLL